MVQSNKWESEDKILKALLLSLAFISSVNPDIHFFPFSVIIQPVLSKLEFSLVRLFSTRENRRVFLLQSLRRKS